MRSFIFIAAIVPLLGGCTLMPKYSRPAAPVHSSWSTASAEQNEVPPAADLHWREFFDDPRLQELIRLALENNRDMTIAALRVEQFQAQYRIRRAELYPGAQGSASFHRQQTSSRVTEFNGGSIQSTYSVALGAAFELDLFGRVRSLKREALERYLATEEARKSVQISLVAEVASEYLVQLQLHEAVRIAQQTLESVQTSHGLIKRSFELGAASELDLRTAEGQVELVRVTALNHQQLLAESENALRLLVGRALPETLPEGQPLEEQDLLDPIGVGIPSEVLQRRPDILAAEHSLKAANANIGAARAAFFPRIVLIGSAGTASAELSDLFTGPAATWSFSPRITIPLFDVGGTRAELAVSQISKRIEIANYERAIQVAFREVADALAARAMLEEKIKSQALLVDSQKKRFELTNARYQQGVDDYLAVLLAQQDLYAAQQTFLQFQAARLLNAVTLYRSLGGGWKS